MVALQFTKHNVEWRMQIDYEDDQNESTHIVVNEYNVVVQKCPPPLQKVKAVVDLERL